MDELLAQTTINSNQDRRFDSNIIANALWSEPKISDARIQDYGIRGSSQFVSVSVSIISLHNKKIVLDVGLKVWFLIYGSRPKIGSLDYLFFRFACVSPQQSCAVHGKKIVQYLKLI